MNTTILSFLGWDTNAEFRQVIQDYKGRKKDHEGGDEVKSFKQKVMRGKQTSKL